MVNNDIVPDFDAERDESLGIKIMTVPDMEGLLVLTLNGYIDTYNSTYFQKRIQRAVDAGFNRLIFNCGSLTYVSSTGIGSFTAFLKIVKSKDGDIVLYEVQPKVLEVFQLLGFSQFFNIRTNFDDSLQFFRDNNGQENARFPSVFACPICTKKLKAAKAGRFRCSECKSILTINNRGQVSLDKELVSK